ncbi:MAG: hypothetical protein IH936_04410 [Acidobacteria bacterium]|nr:hypothetical protein [Acidobacteriota bacterium]
MSRNRMFAITGLTILLSGGAATYAAVSPDQLWFDVDESAYQPRGERWIVPQVYRTVRIDWPGVRSVLESAPLEGSTAASTVNVIFSLPLPDGSFGHFRVEESPVMAPELAAEFPEIKTYAGIGIDDPYATVRFDTTPAGFHAMIQSPSGSVFIDPYARDDTDVYVSYFKRDYLPPEGTTFECRVDGGHQLPPQQLAPLPAAGEVPTPQLPSGATRRTVDLAVAATGEYTGFHGGTAAAGQAAIVTAINRVNQVYNAELSIFYVLVAGNSALVFTDPLGDPYTNSCSGAELGINQTTIDGALGVGGYDLGHVFGGPGGGGGLAGAGPCLNGSSSAAGCTGLATPTGDPFWIDFVAHEMGHQWNAPHTWNGSTGSCSPGNANLPTAWEPGSGSTILAYAGICAPQDLQPNSDAYFHGGSIDTIESYDPTAFGPFLNCMSPVATGNALPVANAGVDRTIPKSTPFELCGSATDGNGTPLTYGWEQFDAGGPQGPPNVSTVTTGPMFRSFTPVASPCRTFPKLSDILNNTATIGEILPSVARALNFRLRARDNLPAGGGTGDDAMLVTVDGASGPFTVTAPNTAVTWTGGTNQNVSWNVANTNAAPVSCAAVNILLSTDGGLSFPTTLAAGTPNDGSQAVAVPNVTTATARIKVQCATNVFFDIGDANFTINAAMCTGGTPDMVMLNTAQGTSTHKACTRVTAQNGFSTQAGATVLLQAGVDVVFENGSSAGNGLTVLIQVP